MHNFASNLDTITPDMWITNENEYLKELLQLPSWHQIPLLNCNATHNMPDSTLVRFRGMVQDMQNPEFYFESFEIYNSVTNEVRTKSGKYRDTANIGENEKINYASNLKSAQRQSLVVVSLPGLNQWAQDVEEKQNKLSHLENHANSSKRLSLESGTKLKRSFEDTHDEQSDMEVVNDSVKNPRTQEELESTTPVVSREHLLNFPLPNVPSKSCLVKLYSDNETLKINDMIEVIGFLSVDPSLSGEFCKSDSLLMDDGETHADVETITLNPPPSLVPRLHAVHVKKLPHCNPLVAEVVEQETVLKDANIAREHLLKALKELLLGDELVAEFLICHLISYVYHRQDDISLGQFTLNISNIPTHKQQNYTKQLYDIIKQFVTKSYYLPLTLENMNTMALLPKKDYECNRLTSGILQLSKNTHLIVDETQMEQGQLDSTGLSNLTAIGSLIKTQKVEYDFKYYKMEFDSDIPVLILSEGKSLLPSDFHVPLEPEESSLSIFKEIVEAANYYLKADIMDCIRQYLTCMQLVQFTMKEDVKFVEDDFIAMRNAATTENPVTGEDLHRLLVLARLLSLSRGYNALDKQCWDLAVKYDELRRQRLKKSPLRS